LVLFLFFPGVPAVFLREGYTGNITPCRVLVVQFTYLFSPLSEGTEAPSLRWWGRDSPVITVGSTESLWSVGGRPPGSCRVTDSHSVEELAFQLLKRGG
jgi:hypothetical protein